MSRSVRLVPVIAVSCLVLLAGCSGFAAENPQTTPRETTSSPSQTSPTTTTAPTTATSTSTTVTYTQGLEDEIRVANYQNEPRSVAVNVTTDNGTVVFETTVTVDANESVGYNVSYPDPGTYVVTALVGNESTSRTYDVQTTDPDSRVGVAVLDDGIQIDEAAV